MFLFLSCKPITQLMYNNYIPAYLFHSPCSDCFRYSQQISRLQESYQIFEERAWLINIVLFFFFFYNL
jgi:hypothetical protein